MARGGGSDLCLWRLAERSALLWLVSAFALGHGLFEGVAQRRTGVERARALRRAREGSVLGIGAVLAAIALIPVVNLIVPVLGTAAMTHLLHRNDVVISS